MPRLPRRTEWNIKEFLIEELRKKSIKVETELSFPLVKGRKQPDAVLKNGGEYYLETELGPQTKLIDGLLQSQDYVKTLQGIGGFAVLFPDELRKPMPREVLEKIIRTQKYQAVATFSEKDPRTPQRFEGTLEQVADWIARDVLKPLEIPEPDTGLTIATLRDAVEYLSASLVGVDVNDIQQVFGGTTVFENILQFEKGSYPVQELRKATTYLLVNQILFYHVLSQIEKDRYTLLDENSLSSPADLLKYFRKVLEQDYTPTFGFNVADKIPKNALDVVRKTVAAIKILKPEKIRYDLLGKVFHELIPFDDRKYVAAFYTNNEAAELLASLVIKNSNDTIADLACGSGTLLVASYHQKRRLVESREGTFSASHHKEFLEKEITGIDIMPFAAHLAVVHLSLQAPLYQTERARIAVWDSTQLKPGKVIPAIAKELMEGYKQSKLEHFTTTTTKVIDGSAYITKGVVTPNKIGGESIKLDPVDVVIMNPPFTRQERLPEGYKRRLEDSLQNYKTYFHGQLGLHGYFIFLADSFLKDGGRLALVLPATVLRVQSTESLRKFLSEKYTIEYIITAWKKLAFSEAAWFREILLVARKSDKVDPDETCLLVTLDTLPRDYLHAIQIADRIKKFKEIPDRNEDEWFKVIRITQRELQKNVGNWFKHISVYDHKIEEVWETFEDNSALINFERLLKKKKGEIIRGAETKSTSSMTIQAATILSKEDRMKRSGYEWVLHDIGKNVVHVVNKFSGQHLSLPRSAILPAFISPSGFGKFDVGDDLDYIVTSKFDKEQEFFYKFDKRKLPTLLKEWKQYVNERQGNLLISRRIVLPVSGFVHLCYYSDEPIVGPGMMWVVKNVPKKDAKIIDLWMNSTLHLSQVLVNKIEDVWINIHQYALADYKVLNPDSLEDGKKRDLLKLYERLSKIDFPSLEEQIRNRFRPRIELDSAILTALGFEKSKIPKLLDQLYDAFENEFDVLKEFMKQTE